VATPLSATIARVCVKSPEGNGRFNHEGNLLADIDEDPEAITVSSMAHHHNDRANFHHAAQFDPSKHDTYDWIEGSFGRRVAWLLGALENFVRGFVSAPRSSPVNVRRVSPPRNVQHR
jgi:hypothetical protein